MCGELTSDSGIAGELADQISPVDMSAALRMTLMGTTTVVGARDGESLGNGLRTVLVVLDELIDQRAEDLRQIAIALAEADAALARGLR